MTKIAILADIHGNMDALTAVLKDATLQKVERLFMCGDITGYYYDTASVWKALNTWDAVMCRGNHETILSKWLAGNSNEKELIKKKYGSSYQIVEETMNKDDIDSLLSLPHPCPVEVDGVRFLVCHGAPWDKNMYLYPDMKEESRQKLLRYADEYDVIFMGHTHYQMVIENNNFLALNAGSVGQPRSGKESSSSSARAQWAIYDTKKRDYSFITSVYDPSRIFEQASQYDPHLPYLKTVLTRQEIVA